MESVARVSVSERVCAERRVWLSGRLFLPPSQLGMGYSLGGRVWLSGRRFAPPGRASLLPVSCRFAPPSQLSLRSSQFAVASLLPIPNPSPTTRTITQLPSTQSNNPPAHQSHHQHTLSFPPPTSQLTSLTTPPFLPTSTLPARPWRPSTPPFHPSHLDVSL